MHSSLRLLSLGASVAAIVGVGVMVAPRVNALADTTTLDLTQGGPRRSCPPPADPGAAVASAAVPTATVAAAPLPDPVTTGTVRVPPSNPFATRIVVVEWKIKPGRECDFMNYWATRSTIPNRTGLIGEFLNEVDKKAWVNWRLEEEPTTYVNVGIWRDAAAFEDQIGKYIDNNRPPLEFEASKRTRVFLAPERWRIGMAALPAKDPDGVR